MFVVPGANLTEAALDLACTLIRRAERRLVAYQAGRGAPAAVNPQVGVYLNRVSDLLNVLARHAAAGEDESASHDAETGIVSIRRPGSRSP